MVFVKSDLSQGKMQIIQIQKGVQKQIICNLRVVFLLYKAPAHIVKGSRKFLQILTWKITRNNSFRLKCWFFGLEKKKQ
jgi:hypothetical protein